LERLAAGVTRLNNPWGNSMTFEVEPLSRQMLLEGLDPIRLTLRHVDEMLAFETRERAQRPWIHQI
jgi:3-isopropylmalate/(R)-2-methylmalate dehydratase small subunit